MDLKALEEKKNDLITRAEELLGDAEKNERAFSEEEVAEINKIQAEVKGVKDAINLAKQIREEQPMETVNNNVETKEQIETREYKEFETYLRNCTLEQRVNNLTPAENSGEAIIPTTIANKIISKVYDVCPVLERSSKYNVKGELQIPHYTETSGSTAITVAYANEFSDLTSAVGVFSNVTLTGYLAGALALISRKLINNTNFNIVDFVVNKMAEAIARFIEKEMLNGTDGKVTGLSSATNSITAAASTAITADEVIRLKDKVKDNFQGNAIFIMSSATRTALRLLKDKNDRYLLQDDIASPFGTTLLGKPVYVSDNMPDMATGVKAIYYGDMSGVATKFGEEINIQVLREKYATQHAVGVVGWVEFDSKIENEQAIAVLKMA